MYRTASLKTLIACGLLALATPPASAAPPKKPVAKAPAAKAPAGPKLKSISVVPSAVRLVGPRAEQGLIVTGHYADGSLRDLTSAAAFRINNPRAVKLAKDESRRVLQPVADGSASVTVTVAGAPPAVVRAEAKNTGSEALVSFRDEVIPALTKAGCSMGTCHGTPTGKGGFRLSLQGYAPELDYQAIVGEGGGRRVNKADPGRSLILLKPMVELPHAGGKRLSPEMPEYQVLTRWIAQGLRDDTETAPKLEKVEILPGPRSLKLPAGAKQQIAAMAHFADGTVRDVTSLAKLTVSDEDAATITREGLVRSTRRGDLAVIVRYQEFLEAMPITYLQDVPGFKWSSPPEHNYVDRHVYNRLKLFQIPPSGLSSDREFLRRAYLDAIGLLPTPDEVRAFIQDTSPDKRARLVDQLTERPEFADFWALKWADVLRVQDETLKDQGAKLFHKWIRESIAANKPVDEFVREVLTASGPTYEAAPANFYRTWTEPDEFAQATAQLFLGVRMACAKCHNHPFERWTQDEYYQFAAFFSQVKQGKGKGKDEALIELDPGAEVTHLRTGKVMKPRLLGANFPEIGKDQDRRPALAQWLTAKDNPFFAKAMVNRIWANLLGRGIVEPIDDFRASNPPTNPELLDALAKDFAQHFDLRRIVRTIMSSRTYQLTARPLPLNKDDTLYFSHAATRLMTAEQLADAVAQVTGVPDEYPGFPAGTRAMQLPGTKSRTMFLKTFGRPDRNLNCECEREKDPTLFQALALISGRAVHDKLRHETGRIAALARSEKPHPQVIEELYLSTLARPPSPREQREWIAHLGKTPDRREALEDMAWVLMNSKEFLFRH
jgi:hypothetical protein